MAWLAVDKDGSENVFSRLPHRGKDHENEVLVESETIGVWYPKHTFIDVYDCVTYSDWITLPKGSIKKLIGRDLTWEDEPVEI